MGFDDIEAEGDDGNMVDDGLARITIEHNGGAIGTVVGPNGFACSQGSCTLEIPRGSDVTLRGLAADDSWFAGWTSVCGGNFECNFKATADATIFADFSPSPNRVFVTSTTTTGGFGGVAGADAICAARATAAGLSGSFVAYISDSTNNAITRVQSSRGWIRLDGAPFADAPTAFADGKILFPPRLDEYGNDIGSVQMFTGTSWGSIAVNLCSDWTQSGGGQTGAMADSEFASSVLKIANRACSTAGHLLCVETGRIIPVTARPNTGKLAFSTKTPWTPGGGLAGADAHCASEAASAGLSGNFLAALPTTTQPIASRFPAGAIYRRVDGVRILRTGGMFATDWLDVPPELDQLGARIESDFWSGVTRFSSVPTAAENCNDWTDNTALQNGHMHFTTRTDVRTPAKTYPCDSATALLCLEN